MDEQPPIEMTPFHDEDPDPGLVWPDKETDIQAAAREYTDKGYRLVAFYSSDTKSGKGPKDDGWGTQALDPETLNGQDALGLIHGLSGTVVVDGDHLALTRDALGAYSIDTNAMPGNPPAYVGNPENRRKWLYRLPDGMEAPSGAKKLVITKDGKNITVFEIRGAPADIQAQDVLPPSPHKVGGQYRWLSEDLPARDDLPKLPMTLFEIWSDWERQSRLIKASLGCEDEIARQALERHRATKKKAPKVDGLSSGDVRDTAALFNERTTIHEILVANNYSQHGDRYLHPDSESGVPGIVILKDKDGTEVAFSHGGGALADGNVHDAFDCMRLLEHHGDWHSAARAAEDAIVMPDGRTLSKHKAQEYAQAKEAEEAAEDFDQVEADPDKPAEPHPLLRFRDHVDEAVIPPMVIDGVLAEGVSVFASYPGRGKTSAWVALCMAVCGAMEIDGLEVITHRDVIYMAEDSRQIETIVMAMAAMGLIDREAAKRFQIVDARKMSIPQIVKGAQPVRDMAVPITINKVTRMKAPYLVLDTASAALAIEDENDNTRMSEVIAAIKQAFYDIPVTIISHTSKAHKHGDPKTMTVRGASAIEGDVNQVIYLSDDATDPSVRYIEIQAAKHRFESTCDCIMVKSDVAELFARDEFDQMRSISVRYAELEVLTKEDRRAKLDEPVYEFICDVINTIRSGKQVAAKNVIWNKSTEVVNAMKEDGEDPGFNTSEVTDKTKLTKLLERLVKAGVLDGCKIDDGVRQGFKKDRWAFDQRYTYHWWVKPKAKVDA